MSGNEGTAYRLIAERTGQSIFQVMREMNPVQPGRVVLGLAPPPYYGPVYYPPPPRQVVKSGAQVREDPLAIQAHTPEPVAQTVSMATNADSATPTSTISQAPPRTMVEGRVHACTQSTRCVVRHYDGRVHEFWVNDEGEVLHLDRTEGDRRIQAAFLPIRAKKLCATKCWSSNCLMYSDTNDNLYCLIETSTQGWGSPRDLNMQATSFALQTTHIKQGISRVEYFAQVRSGEWHYLFLDSTETPIRWHGWYPTPITSIG